MQRKVAIGLAVFVAVVAGISWLNASWTNKAGFVVTLVSNGGTLISDQDVTFYNATSHQFGLTAGCVARLGGLDLYHKAFDLSLDGRFLGNGSFWASMDSMPPPKGLSFLDIRAIQDGSSTSAWMEACYPSGYYPNCTTPSFFGDIAAHFQSLGKLVY